jgi:hypothetical protein
MVKVEFLKEFVGVLNYADGRKYEGEFKDDKKNGKGISESKV